MFFPPNYAEVSPLAAPSALPVILMIVFLLKLEHLTRVGQWMKRWGSRCVAIARKKGIEIVLLLTITFMIGCFRDTGFRAKEWQNTLPVADAAPGDPSHFVWDSVWLEPLPGGMRVNGLPDGDVTLSFGYLSWLRHKWMNAGEYGTVICGELEVCVGEFQVDYETGNFARLVLLSTDGQIDREYWLRFPAPGRLDSQGRHAIQARLKE